MAATDEHPYVAGKLDLVYTYPADDKEPEKEYHVGGFAAEKVLERCTDHSLVNMAVEFEKLRYAYQVVLGRRGLAERVDMAASRYFQTGRLDPLQTADRSEVRRVAKTTVVPDFDLLDDDELEV